MRKDCPARHNTKWTQEELDYLIENIGDTRLSLIAKRLNRTEKAVLAKCDKLRIPVVGSSEKFQLSDVARIMNVDVKTVWNWTNKYGLKYTLEILREVKRPQIELENLVEWLEKNQDRWDSTKLEQYALSSEPKWLIEKRKKDFNRHDKRRKKPWTEREIKTVYSMLAMHKDWEEIGIALGRTTNPNSLREALRRHFIKQRRENASNEN